MFINMDETAVYFDTGNNYTVNKRGSEAVSIRQGNSDNKRCTVCVTVAADGIKLFLFIIFKDAVIRRGAINLHQIIPDGMYGCTRPKAWMDNQVMQLWKETVWKPYVEDTVRSTLIMDRMEFHMHPDFIDTVDELRNRVVTIPGGFMTVS